MPSDLIKRGKSQSDADRDAGIPEKPSPSPSPIRVKPAADKPARQGRGTINRGGQQQLDELEKDN